MDKKAYVGTNFKMYKTICETEEYLVKLKKLTGQLPEEIAEIFVIPSFTALPAAGAIVKDSRIKLGAQNMCWEDMGPFTGEISPVMLKEFGTEIVEIGHSERRHTFGETDEEERKKVRKALEHGLIPLLCVGETLQQRKRGIGDEILSMQIKTALYNLPLRQMEKIRIAYEPVWAIGVNGIPAEPQYVAGRHSHMRDLLIDMLGERSGNCIPLIYGGSVNLKNAKQFIGMENVDGLFVGRSAWDVENFWRIIQEVLYQ